MDGGRSVYVEFEEVLGGLVVVVGLVLIIVKRFIVFQLFDGNHRQTALHALRQLRRVRTWHDVRGQVEQVDEHLVSVTATCTHIHTLLMLIVTAYVLYYCNTVEWTWWD